MFRALRDSTSTSEGGGNNRMNSTLAAKLLSAFSADALHAAMHSLILAACIRSSGGAPGSMGEIAGSCASTSGAAFSCCRDCASSCARNFDGGSVRMISALARSRPRQEAPSPGSECLSTTTPALLTSLGSACGTFVGGLKQDRLHQYVACSTSGIMSGWATLSTSSRTTGALVDVFLLDGATLRIATGAEDTLRGARCRAAATGPADDLDDSNIGATNKTRDATRINRDA